MSLKISRSFSKPFSVTIYEGLCQIEKKNPSLFTKLFSLVCYCQESGISQEDAECLRKIHWTIPKRGGDKLDNRVRETLLILFNTLYPKPQAKKTQKLRNLLALKQSCPAEFQPILSEKIKKLLG